MAAVEYLAAYELFQEPAFFYNTAEVYRLAADEKNALVYYQKYLELDPHGKGAASSRAAIDQLRRSITIFLISAMAFPGLRPFGQVRVQLRMVWHR